MTRRKRKPITDQDLIAKIKQQDAELTRLLTDDSLAAKIKQDEAKLARLLADDSIVASHKHKRRLQNEQTKAGPEN